MEGLERFFDIYLMVRETETGLRNKQYGTGDTIDRRVDVDIKTAHFAEWECDKHLATEIVASLAYRGSTGMVVASMTKSAVQAAAKMVLNITFNEPNNPKTDVVAELQKLCGRADVYDIAVASVAQCAMAAILDQMRIAIRPEVDPALPAGEVVGHYYKVKTHAGADRKVNIHAIEVIAGMKNHAPAAYSAYYKYSGNFKTLYDDQVAGVLVFMLAVGCTGLGALAYTDALVLGLYMVVLETRDQAGKISDCLKTMGLAAYMPWFVEGKCLLGRGVGEIDVASKAMERLQSQRCAYDGNERDLRLAVAAVMATEVPVTPTFPSLEEFWARRWLWSANGGHSRAVEHAHPELATRTDFRAYRKCVLEQWEENPMPGWDGRVCVTPSQKLEHGKSRLLLACDTVSYLWFEYYLRPVEKVWANRRAILEPGSISHTRIGDEVAMFGSTTDGYMTPNSGEVFVSLDYEDFNSQHSLVAQKMVFEELFRRIGLEDDNTRRVISSFDKMDVYIDNVKRGTARYSLMSGHRATTFINTVLNRAYLLAAGLKTDWSYHVGDDVLMRMPYCDREQLYTILGSRGVRLNPSKQCTNGRAGEFLRVSHCGPRSCGYITRAVASAVSGNWVSSHVLDKQEALTNAVTCLRSIANRTPRGECDVLCRVVALSVAKRAGVVEAQALRLLKGEACLGDGVVYGTTCNFINKFEVQKKLGLKDMWSEHLQMCATADYLRNCVTNVEKVAIDMCGSDIADIMAQSSWMKSISEKRPDTVEVQLNTTMTKVTSGFWCVTDAELRHMPVVEGVFEKYPVLMMLKERVSVYVEGVLCNILGVDPQQRREKLWGTQCKACIIDGILPYSEACALAKRAPTSGVRIKISRDVKV